MTPQVKAIELFNKYFSEIRMPSDCEGCMQCVDRCGNMVAIAKKYSLMAVEEVLASLDYDYIGFDRQNKYWQEVKQEINNL